jgi:hypothetical protein
LSLTPCLGDIRRTHEYAREDRRIGERQHSGGVHDCHGCSALATDHLGEGVTRKVLVDREER